MDRRFFDRDITRVCEYCKFGVLSDDGVSILCKKKGVMELFDYCRSYKYDATKRKPKLPIPTFDFKPEDFKL